MTSELDLQEVRNAVDQARRDVATRFDFKGTESTIDLSPTEIVLETTTEDRLGALRQLLEEKLVRRHVSLKALDPGKVEEASHSRVRQHIALVAGISAEKAKQINRAIKEQAPKGVTSQTQGDRVRVTGKKRDDLQAVIAALRAADFGIPLQFGNFRD